MKKEIQNVKNLHIKLCIKGELKDLKEQMKSTFYLIRIYQLRIEKIEKLLKEN